LLWLGLYCILGEVLKPQSLFKMTGFQNGIYIIEKEYLNFELETWPQ